MAVCKFYFISSKKVFLYQAFPHCCIAIFHMVFQCIVLSHYSRTNTIRFDSCFIIHAVYIAFYQISIGCYHAVIHCFKVRFIYPIIRINKYQIVPSCLLYTNISSHRRPFIYFMNHPNTRIPFRPLYTL